MVLPVDGSAVLSEKVNDHVVLITINREAAHNAINHDVAQGLERAVEATESDPDIRAVILTGAGTRTFCAGADLKQVAAGGLSDLFTLKGGFAGFVTAPRSKPWIAAVNGVALAGGFELVLSCDLVVAADTARFGLPEVTVGLIAAAGGLFRLPRRIPATIALEVIATGTSISAERAFALGLVNQLCAARDTLEQALMLATVIGDNAPLAVQESLRIARAAQSGQEADLFAASKHAQDFLRMTEDFREGPRAFIEKRHPVWQGR